MVAFCFCCVPFTTHTCRFRSEAASSSQLSSTAVSLSLSLSPLFMSPWRIHMSARSMQQSNFPFPFPFLEGQSPYERAEEMGYALCAELLLQNGAHHHEKKKEVLLMLFSLSLSLSVEREPKPVLLEMSLYPVFDRRMSVFCLMRTDISAQWSR